MARLPRSRNLRRLLLGTCLALGFALGGAQPALATNFPVTKTADTNDGTCDSDCSLREAIVAVNGGSGGDTITVPAGHYILSLGELEIDVGTTINGAGARSTIVDGNGQSRVFDVSTGTGENVTINNLTVTRGVAPTGMFAFFAGDGGGILTVGPLLTLNEVAVVGNSAAFSGGGIDAAQETLIQPAVTINRSTIADNHVTGGAGNGQGGGMTVFGPLTMTNSTVSGNSSENPGLNQGGGVVAGADPDSPNAPTSTLLNVTIAGNSISGSGVGDLGGGLSGDNLGGPVASNLSAKNTIIAGNTVNGATQDCGLVNTVVTSHNLSSDSTCGFGDAGSKQNADPLLRPLQDNSGPTDTRALITGSPAINAGDNNGCPGTDQRGIARPQVAICDIGAFELLFLSDLAVTKSAPATVTLGKSLVYTIKVTNNGPQPAAGVKLTDGLPLAAVSSTPAGLCSGTPLVCDIGALGVGESRTITVTTRPKKAGTLTNTAAVTGTYLDPDTANNSATATTKVKKPALPLSVAGAGGACHRGDFNVRARAKTSASLKSLTVLVDGRRVASTKKHSKRVRIHVKSLGSGRHTLTVQATDRYGTKRTTTAHFFVCPRPAARFTG